MDRQQNSYRITELKGFLDKNIAMLKNNWDDKRHVETQTTALNEDGEALNFTLGTVQTAMGEDPH